MNKVTEKQANFISIIQNVLGVKFEGTSKSEASKYISDNIEAFKKQHYLLNKKEREDKKAYWYGCYRRDKPAYNMYKKF